MSRKWGIPDSKSQPMVLVGTTNWLMRKAYSTCAPRYRSALARFVHDRFSVALAKQIPLDTEIFIGLSSFCCEALVAAKRMGAAAIADHGSFHQAEERKLLMEESELHGLDLSHDLPQDWLIAKENREFEVADYVMVLSKAAKRTVLAQGVHEAKVFVNNCGVDLRSFKRAVKVDGMFRVIHCGAITPTKGVHYLLQAFYESKLPKSELWLIGPRPTSGGLVPIINRYRAPNIRFLGGIPQTELSTLYSQGSVLVSASIADGFGMVVPQAMACGLPVIVTENVGAADVVEHGKTGFVIPIRDVGAIREKLTFLYENLPVCLEMGNNAFNSVTRGHTWDDYGRRLAGFLTSLAR
jgi:glycosyltransferase involved in cell wall biosynthesis